MQSSQGGYHVLATTDSIPISISHDFECLLLLLLMMMMFEAAVMLA